MNRHTTAAMRRTVRQLEQAVKQLERLVGEMRESSDAAPEMNHMWPSRAALSLALSRKSIDH